MGKNDDFAARHARIREQSIAPDPTGGFITDPRPQRRETASSLSLLDKFGLFFDLRMAVGGILAVALGIYALSPAKGTSVSATHAVAGATYAALKTGSGTYETDALAPPHGTLVIEINGTRDMRALTKSPRTGAMRALAPQTRTDLNTVSSSCTLTGHDTSQTRTATCQRVW